MVYLISYTLFRPGQDYKDLHKAIKEISGIWWHHTTSAWAVESNLSAEQIYKHLSPFVDSNDDLIVLRLQGQYWGKIADSSSTNWLRARTF